MFPPGSGSISTIPYYPMNAFRNCDGPFTARYELCSDWNLFIYRDGTEHLIERIHHEGENFLSNSARGNNYGVEVEQWKIPQGFRPDPGDRAFVVGRFIADCAEDWHTEIHPFELIVSSFTQFSDLDTSLNVPRMDRDSPTFISQRASSINLPPVSTDWSEITSREPATIHKIVLPGVSVSDRTFTFYLYPPPRPSESATLRWADQAGGGYRSTSGLEVTVVPLPAGNPNHLRFTITTHPPSTNNLFQFGIMGDVHYPNAPVMVDSYALWWER